MWPLITVDPKAVEVTLWLDHCVQVPWKYIKVCGYMTLFWNTLIDPWMTFDPKVLLRSHVWLYPRIIVSKSHENTSKYVDTVTLFAKTWTRRSVTPRWPLTPHLLRSHVWLYPRIIVSKSHGNTSLNVDTVINFANYHIHTTNRTKYYVLWYIRYILDTEWVIT